MMSHRGGRIIEQVSSLESENWVVNSVVASDVFREISDVDWAVVCFSHALSF